MSIVIPEGRGASNPYLNRVQIVQGDITDQEVDAIVALLPQTMEYRGSLNESIRDKAGAELDVFMKGHVVNPRPGDVYAIPGFGLPAKHIFFAIVPLWKNDFDRHDRQLLNAVRKSMEQTRAMGLKTIAMPSLGAGKSGFPIKRAARLILQGVSDRLDGYIGGVNIVCRDPKTKRVFEDRLDMMRFNFN